MRYTVKLRMKNPGPAKYLIESRDADNMVKAFEIATAVLTNVDEKDYFVEIIDNETNERVAGFNNPEAA